MRSVRLALLAIIVLSVFVVPSFADQPGGPSDGVWQDVFGRDPYEAEVARAGESSVGFAGRDAAESAIFDDLFSQDPYEAEAARAGLAATRPDSVPPEVWAAIYDREGFIARASGALEAATINGMSAEQWAAISDRDGFRTKMGQGSPYAAPQPVYRIVATRYGFDVRASASERAVAWVRPASTPPSVWAQITGRDGFAVNVDYDICGIC